MEQANEKRNTKISAQYSRPETRISPQIPQASLRVLRGRNLCRPRKNHAASKGEKGANDCADAVDPSRFLWKRRENRSETKKAHSRCGFVRVHPRKSAAKAFAPKNKCGRGPATPDRIRTWFPACLITAGRRNDRFSPSALALSQATSAAFAKASYRFADLKTEALRSPTRNRCGGQRPVSRSTALLLRRAKNKERERRRPQRPGNQSALARFSGMSPDDSPSRITGCRWLCRNHSASSGNSHVSLNPLSATLLRPATQKTSPLVQKLWTMCLPCGSPRKTKN